MAGKSVKTPTAIDNVAPRMINSDRLYCQCNQEPFASLLPSGRFGAP